MKEFLPQIIAGVYVWLMAISFCLLVLTGNEIFWTIMYTLAAIVLLPASAVFIIGGPIVLIIIVIREIYGR